MEVLIGEGVEFDENGCASQAQRLRPAELEALLDPEPPAAGKTGSWNVVVGEIERLEDGSLPSFIIPLRPPVGRPAGACVPGSSRVLFPRARLIRDNGRLSLIDGHPGARP